MIEDEGDVLVWTVRDLTADSGRFIELAIRLPAIYEPGFNLQLIAGKDLDAHSVEKPRSVRRNERRLIGPIIEVVEAPKPDIGQEDSGINIDAMHLVDVVSTVSFRDVTVSIIEAPLAACDADVIARLGLRIHPELRHHPATNVVVMKVPAQAQLCELDFTRAKDLTGAADRVVLRMVETAGVVHVESDFRSKEF